MERCLPPHAGNRGELSHLPTWKLANDITVGPELPRCRMHPPPPSTDWQLYNYSQISRLCHWQDLHLVRGNQTIISSRSPGLDNLPAAANQATS